MPAISIVIPVHCAEQTLPELYRQLAEAMPQITPEFEIIFVEDGGRDNSWSVIVDLARKDRRVRGIRLSRNYGQHNALLCGIRAAKYEIIVTMDDDLQHPVSEIAPMVAALKPEYDVVYGKPRSEQHGFWRDVASRLTKMALASAIGVANARSVSAFRVFRTHVREGFEESRSPSVSIDVLLTWATSRFTAIEVCHKPRAAGTSGYTFGKLVQYALDLMTGFSTLPLRITIYIGFAFVLFGIAIFAYVLITYLTYGSRAPGFAFLASIIAIFSGAQLFTLGIFGEYLARMHMRSMDRPAYLVVETTAMEASDEIATPPLSTGGTKGRKDAMFETGG